MAPSSQHSARGRSHKPVFFLALLCLVGTACGTTSPTGKVLFEDPRGTVLLKTIPDRSFQASHPINLEPTLLAQVLKGLQIQDQERALQSMLIGRSSPSPVFSEDQIRFLAPLLAEGLRTAAPDQCVEYRVQTTRKGSALESSITETTAGSLYAYGLSLYVTLSQYRYAPAQINVDSPPHGRLLDSSGLSNRTLHFTPSAAQRSDSFYRPAGGASTDRVLAIDYEILQHASPLPLVTASEQTTPQMERVVAPAREPLPEPGTFAASPQTTDTMAQREAEIRTLKDLVIQKDLENFEASLRLFA